MTSSRFSSGQASVFVSSLDANGELVARAFGVFVAKGVILTAFQNIDGASTVRVDFADGSNTSVSDLLSWNRRQDWAVLKVDDAKVQPFESAVPRSEPF